MLLSFIACIAGTLLTRPVDEETLKNFYRNVRPWGFWGPVHALVVKDDPTIERNTDAGRDLLNCGVGICWQLTLLTIPLYVVFRDLRGTLISLAVLIVTMIFLKKSWYDNLESGEGRTGLNGAVLASGEDCRGCSRLICAFWYFYGGPAASPGAGCSQLCAMPVQFKLRCERKLLVYAATMRGASVGTSNFNETRER